MSSIDFSKIDKAKEQLAAQLNKFTPGVKFWQAKTGKNHIRVLPGWTDKGEFAGQFWCEVTQHWNVNSEKKGPVVCVEKTAHLTGKCPVCEFIKSLQAMGDTPSAQQLAHEIRAKKAWFISIVDLKDPIYTQKDYDDYASKGDNDPPFEVGDTKIQVYAANVPVFNQIITTIQNNKLDITKLDSGHNLFVSKVQKSGKKKEFVGYEVSPELMPSPIDVDVSKLPDLSAVARIYSYEEALNLLAEGVGEGFDLPLFGSNTKGQLPLTNDESDVDDEDDSDFSSSDDEDLEKEMMAALKG